MTITDRNASYVHQNLGSTKFKHQVDTFGIIWPNSFDDIWHTCALMASVLLGIWRVSLGLHLSECSGIISVDAELGGGSALQSVGR
jgi:hypothetical protein